MFNHSLQAKYVAKAFIKGAALMLANSASSGNTGKWTVRRLRRRARTGSLKQLQSDKERRDKEEKEEDTCRPRRVNAEEILFGHTLGKHHVASIQLDSDQESTDGEDQVGEEQLLDLSAEQGDNRAGDDLSKLTPDSLLYRYRNVTKVI